MIRLESSGSDCTVGSGLRENGFNSAYTPLEPGEQELSTGMLPTSAEQVAFGGKTDYLLLP
jgi:hypothetical protein